MDSEEEQDRGARVAESLLAALLLAGVVALQLWAARAGSLFGAHFWTDEVFTCHMVTDPGLGRFFEVLRAGVETQTPGYHLLLRGFTALFPGEPEPVFRFFSLACAWSAMVGVYLLLRGAFRPLAAAAGSLALWCHPLVMHHAFDARYYVPWLALTVWFALLTRSRPGSPPGPARCLALGLVSVLLCSIHYFGILTWGLVVLAEYLLGDRPALHRPGQLGALLAGPAVLVVWIAWLFFPQSRAMEGTHWIAPLSLNDLLGVSFRVLLPALAGGVLLAAFLAACLGGLREEQEAFRPHPLSGLGACVLVVPVLALVSYLYKPVLIPRYAICATLVIPCAVAYALGKVKPFWALAACGLIVLVGTKDIMDLAHHRRGRDQATDRLIAAIRAGDANRPIAFQHTRDLYPVAHYAPDLRDRCVLYAADTADDPVLAFSVVHARIVQSFYGAPGVITPGEAERLPGLYYVPDAGASGRPPAEIFPGFEVRPVSGRLVRLSNEG